MSFPNTGKHTIQGDIDSDVHRFNCYAVYNSGASCMAIPTAEYKREDGEKVFYITPVSGDSPNIYLMKVDGTNEWLAKETGSEDLVFVVSDSEPSDSKFQFVLTEDGTEGEIQLYTLSPANNTSNFVTILGPKQDDGYPVKSKPAGKGKTQKWKFVPVLTND